jgi:shikimate dehydrogenase
MIMDIYAVTGNPVAHSLSPQLFNQAFKNQGIDAVYTRLAADSAGEALDLAREIGLRGLNVTAPFKEGMPRLLDGLDPEAKEIGAVNGVVFSGRGRAFGFNTDGRGAAGALAANGVELRGKKVAVIGAGGAGRAAVSGLTREGAKVSLVNRTFLKAAELARRFGCKPEPLENLPGVVAGADLVVSAVSAADQLIKPEWLAPGQVIMDANYRDSRLPEIARGRGCRVVDGMDWLLAQAIPAFEFFTGRRVEPRLMGEALVSARARERKASSISLVGMMGAGKTTVGRKLSSVLGATIPWIFQHWGEGTFRLFENQVVERLRGEPRREIYALGGGAVARPENRDIVRGRTLVIWLWAGPERILERIPVEGRPLLEGGDRNKRLAELIASRLPDYARASDLVINANRTVEDIIRKIRDEVN